MLVRKRKSRILSNKAFFDYPISLNFQTLRKLGFIEVFFISFSYLKSVFFPIKQENSLEDFLINRFGKRLYLYFFKSYTEKVWGVPCTDISAEWGRQRIKGLSITKTITTAITKKFRFGRKSISQKNNRNIIDRIFPLPQIWSWSNVGIGS